MNVLSRWRNRRARRLETSWETIPATELGDQPHLLAELTSGRRNGITITDVLTPAELDGALEVLGSLEKSETTERPFGWILGLPIGMLGDGTDRTPYYDDGDRAQGIYRKAFGFDPHERISEVLEPIAGGLRLVPPVEDGRRYNPGQIRWWEPGGGGLVAHVGNEFRTHLEKGPMSHLVTTTQVTNHLSYFVVLQRAEIGGQLSIYDLTWSDNPGRDDWGEEMPDDSWIESVPATRLDLGPGELVLFGGGWRWHRVEPPMGSTPRVTYGGFAAPSVDGDELHFWC